ncbi:hypothetical protein C1T02_26265, partial [Vibrio parahaemolyticus]
RGFIFSGVKVKAKHLRSQMDLLKIRPIRTRKAHHLVSLSCWYRSDLQKIHLRSQVFSLNLYPRKNKTPMV